MSILNNIAEQAAIADPLALSPVVERLARAVSCLCWRRPNEPIAAGEIERAASLQLEGAARRETWASVRAFYQGNEDMTFHNGAVCWRRKGAAV